MTAWTKQANLSSLLSPKTLAITGATRNPEDLGSYVLRNIVFGGFEGKIFPICKEASELYSFDTYGSIRDIKEEVDLAILATSADRVIDDVYDCTRSKVNHVCIISRGFAEIGQQGLRQQKKLQRMLNEAHITLLGPNSLGMISTGQKLNATFGPAMPPCGKTVFMSQSGALINTLIEYATFYSLGLNEVIGLGNKAGIHEIDLLAYYSSLREDGQPSVIGAYLENIADGGLFVDVCSQATKKFPVVMLIPSDTPKVCEYIYAHTGSILQRREMINLAAKQAGILQVSTQQQLYDLLLTLSWQMLPRGNNIAVVSNAGGGLILAIDEIYQHNLRLVNLSSEIKRMLVSELDWKGNSAGVVDLGGEALSLNYLKALDIVLGDHDVNTVVVILSPQVMTDIEEVAETIGRLAQQHGKPVIGVFLGYEGVEKGIRALAKHFIPAFNTTERAIHVLAKAYEYHIWKEKGLQGLVKKKRHPVEERSRAALEVIERARVAKEQSLGLDDCLRILYHYGISVKDVQAIESLKDLVNFGSKHQYPIEFCCLKQGKGWVLHDENQARQFFEEHFQQVADNDIHSFQQHLVRKIYPKKRRMSFIIQKDVYYEYLNKGLNIHDVAKLSLGHVVQLYNDSRPVNNMITALVPVDSQELDEKLLKTHFWQQLQSGLDVSYDLLRNDLIKVIEKVSMIALDFPQIASVKITSVIVRNRIHITEYEVKLDLMV